MTRSDTTYADPREAEAAWAEAQHTQYGDPLRDALAILEGVKPDLRAMADERQDMIEALDEAWPLLSDIGSGALRIDSGARDRAWATCSRIVALLHRVRNGEG